MAATYPHYATDKYDDNQRGTYQEQQYRRYDGGGGGTRSSYIIMAVEEPNQEARQDAASESPFQNRSVRMLFVRKVLATVGFQLAVCVGFITMCFLTEPLLHFFLSLAGSILALICLLTWIVLLIAIGCCGVGRGRPNPFNITLLLISTVLLSVVAADVVVQYDIPAIMLCAATTVGVVLILSVFTFSTKFDITSYAVYIWGAILAVCLYVLLSSLFVFVLDIHWGHSTNKTLQLVLGGIFALMYSVMILFELKCIVGGGRYQYTEEDWLIASITLFYNVLMFFLQILGISRATSS